MDIKQYSFFQQLTLLPYVEKILLYGSRAKGVNAERTDIDLAIQCPKATDEDWNDILAVIDGADTLLDIDCVRLDKIKDLKFRQSIMESAKVLFQRIEGV